MPFGLHNAAKTFQHFMDSLFKHLPFVFCYLDDIIIASHTLEEHHEHLRQIFTILQENGLQINSVKCLFAAAAVEFLGHRVDQHGVRPLQRHVQTISDFPPPQDVKQLQQFLGIVNFYRSFLLGIAPTAHRRAQGGPQDAVVAAGRHLQSGQGRPGGRSTTGTPSPKRRALSSNRRLRHTRRRRASTAERRELAAAGVLLQEAVGGGHQVLHLRQRAAGRIQRGRHFRFLLEGRQFRLLTDHKPLVTSLFRTTPPWSACQQRQLSFIAEFTSDIRHTPGQENVVADALSRPPSAATQRPPPGQPTSPALATEDWPEEGLTAPEQPILASIADFSAMAAAQRSCPEVA